MEAVTAQNEFCTTQEVAARLRTTPVQLWRIRFDDQVKPLRFGVGKGSRKLYKIADVDAWIASQTKAK